MIFNSSAVNFGASLPAKLEIAFGIFAVEDHAENAGVQFARGDLGGADMFGRIDRGNAGGDVLRKADARAGARLGADRLHGVPMTEHDVVTRLVQFAGRQLQAGRIDGPAITEIEEAAGLVDGEEVLDAIAQALGDVAGIVAERL